MQRFVLFRFERACKIFSDLSGGVGSPCYSVTDHSRFFARIVYLQNTCTGSTGMLPVSPSLLLWSCSEEDGSDLLWWMPQWTDIADAIRYGLFSSEIEHMGVERYQLS